VERPSLTIFMCTFKTYLSHNCGTETFIIVGGGDATIAIAVIIIIT